MKRDANPRFNNVLLAGIATAPLLPPWSRSVRYDKGKEGANGRREWMEKRDRLKGYLDGTTFKRYRGLFDF